jgi:hypothetical protein
MARQVGKLAALGGLRHASIVAHTVVGCSARMGDAQPRSGRAVALQFRPFRNRLGRSRSGRCSRVHAAAYRACLSACGLDRVASRRSSLAPLVRSRDLYIDGKRGKTKVERIIPLFDETRAILAECPKTAVTVITNMHGKPFSPGGFHQAVEKARTKAKIEGKTLHDLRGTFATRLMRRGLDDREIDEILAWEPGKSQRIRRRYISRKAVVISAIERMRERDRSGD